MLSGRFGEHAIAVAVEQSRGALVLMLNKYEQLPRYPIHSCAAAQFSASPAFIRVKDDPVDAELLLDLLTHHRARLRRLNPATEQTLVAAFGRGACRLVNEKTRQSKSARRKAEVVFPPDTELVR